jgi:hypothetical protein
VTGSDKGQGEDRQPGRGYRRVAGWFGAFMAALLWSLLVFFFIELGAFVNEDPEAAGFPIGSIVLFSVLMGLPARVLVRAELGFTRASGVALGFLWVVGVAFLVGDWATCC